MDPAKEGKAWLEEAEVMSEVHIGTDVGITSTVSVFHISPLPGRSSNSKGMQSADEPTSEDEEDGRSTEVRSDEHGDLILPRRKKQQYDATEKSPGDIDAVVVHHSVKTRLPQVGLQIWRGALLLSDFILHTMRTSNDFNHVTTLELGAGTGLAGLVMARVSPLVFITDRGADILDNCTRNVIRNCGSLCRGELTVRVRELDWQNPRLPDEEKCLDMDEIGPYRWTAEDVKDVGDVSVLLAADVVYSMDLTTAFFDILKKLMPPNSKKVLYLAMEKRYNFSLTDLDVVAHGYKLFRTFFTTESSPVTENACLVSSEREQEVDNLAWTNSQHNFFGNKIDISGIPQYVANYERGHDLELWEIRPCKDIPGTLGVDRLNNPS